MKHLKKSLIATMLLTFILGSQATLASQDKAAYQLLLSNGQSVEVLMIQKINVDHQQEDENYSDVEEIYLNGE